MMFLIRSDQYHHPIYAIRTRASAAISTGYRFNNELKFESRTVFYEDGLLHTCYRSNLTRTDDIYGKDTFVVKNVSCEHGMNPAERALIRHRSSSDRYGPELHPF